LIEEAGKRLINHFYYTNFILLLQVLEKENDRRGKNKNYRSTILNKHLKALAKILKN